MHIEITDLIRKQKSLSCSITYCGKYNRVYIEACIGEKKLLIGQESQSSSTTQRFLTEDSQEKVRLHKGQKKLIFLHKDKTWYDNWSFLSGEISFRISPLLEADSDDIKVFKTSYPRYLPVQKRTEDYNKYGITSELHEVSIDSFGKDNSAESEENLSPSSSKLEHDDGKRSPSNINNEKKDSDNKDSDKNKALDQNLNQKRKKTILSSPPIKRHNIEKGDVFERIELELKKANKIKESLRENINRIEKIKKKIERNEKQKVDLLNEINEKNEQLKSLKDNISNLIK